MTAKDLKNYPKLNEFLKHCCVEAHYSFQVKKCGEKDCNICRPLRCEESKTVDFLPFPVMSADGDHYKPFVEVYKTKTTDEVSTSLIRIQCSVIDSIFNMMHFIDGLL